MKENMTVQKIHNPKHTALECIVSIIVLLMRATELSMTSSVYVRMQDVLWYIVLYVYVLVHNVCRHLSPAYLCCTLAASSGLGSRVVGSLTRSIPMKKPDPLYTQGMDGCN